VGELDISCLTCARLLSRWNSPAERHEPPPEELYRAGSVVVPNLGWFCSQDCARKFEEKHGLTLRRDAAGNVSYYD
jgi:hypothetical protein